MSNNDVQKNILLDFSGLEGRRAIHTYLACKLSFPDYYGNNLDALFDCLTELNGYRLILRHPGNLLAMGSYGEAVLETIREAAAKYPERLSIIELDDSQ